MGNKMTKIPYLRKKTAFRLAQDTKKKFEALRDKKKVQNEK